MYTVGDTSEGSAGANEWQALKGRVCHGRRLEPESRPYRTKSLQTVSDPITGCTYFQGRVDAVEGEVVYATLYLESEAQEYEAEFPVSSFVPGALPMPGNGFRAAFLTLENGRTVWRNTVEFTPVSEEELARESAELEELFGDSGY